MHIIAVVQTDIGNVRYLNKQKKKVNELDKESIYETFSEANSIASSKQHEINEQEKNDKFELRVIPLDIILLQLSQTKIKQLINSLEPEQIKIY